ncbi:GNAT family N-acetyltransferase [Patescibacteria group bacterium]|nr:GNAT family N-acetyltransferase [Patescibacteria group bacterium]MBU1891100.1 GNAT family N-acetyltransferase [Patescibacteria group bacterium]
MSMTLEQLSPGLRIKNSRSGNIATVRPDPFKPTRPWISSDGKVGVIMKAQSSRASSQTRCEIWSLTNLEEAPLTTAHFKDGEEVLSTGRIILRRPVLEDLRTFAAWHEDPRLHRLLIGGQPRPLAAQIQWLASVLARPEPTVFPFTIVSVDGGQVIGLISIYCISKRDKRGEIGITIGQESDRDQGYGQEAIRLCLQYAFEALGLVKVVAEIYDFNRSSRRAFAKCGFVEDARLPKHCVVDGKRVDLVLLSIFREAYESSE